jgi:hypothetical protein
MSNIYVPDAWFVFGPAFGLCDYISVLSAEFHAGKLMIQLAYKLPEYL